VPRLCLAAQSLEKLPVVKITDGDEKHGLNPENSPADRAAPAAASRSGRSR
jgi:hypothetical protein